MPLGPRHGVLALRASGAASRGDPIVRRTLRLGGHDADGSVLSFDDDASSLLRGFPADAFFGTSVVLANADYRLPLAYIERGVGTWPLFVRAVPRQRIRGCRAGLAGSRRELGFEAVVGR